ncbi:uncharacterized protein [Miscanthus floridulus]|uniref:uncharacterized protein isoform X2 n=1 Tax=Miscanthus floridulus TaxID=154761 RepID=UPI0034575302
MGQGPSNYPCSSPLLLADTSTAPFPQPHEPSLSKPLLPPLLPSLSRCPPLQHQYLNWSSETDRGGREDQGDVLDRGFPPTSPSGFSWGSLGYALDVNAERADDVVTHQRLLEEARDSERRPALSVRVVQEFTHLCDMSDDTDHSVHLISRPMHEITFATIDKPKLLSQLTCLLAELGLDIQEAHAFSTIDDYSLDVFVVTGCILRYIVEVLIVVIGCICRHWMAS